MVQAAHLHLAVVEVRGAGLVLAVLQGLAQLPVGGSQLLGPRGRGRVRVVGAGLPAPGMCRAAAGEGQGAPVVFLSNGPATGPGGRRFVERNVTFEAQLVEVMGAGEQAGGQVHSGHRQEGDVHARQHGDRRLRVLSGQRVFGDQGVVEGNGRGWKLMATGWESTASSRLMSA